MIGKIDREKKNLLEFIFFQQKQYASFKRI